LTNFVISGALSQMLKQVEAALQPLIIGLGTHLAGQHGQRVKDGYVAMP
jgi:hypothetical protein